MNLNYLIKEYYRNSYLLIKFLAMIIDKSSNKYTSEDIK